METINILLEEYEMVDDFITMWDSKAPDSQVIIETIEHFDARGMKRVYGRGDVVKGHRTYNMDIWKNKSGRLLMRFWSRSIAVDWESYEIIGIDIAELSEYSGKASLKESWVPKSVRYEYEIWVIAN